MGRPEESCSAGKKGSYPGDMAVLEGGQQWLVTGRGGSGERVEEGQGSPSAASRRQGGELLQPWQLWAASSVGQLSVPYKVSQ